MQPIGRFTFPYFRSLLGHVHQLEAGIEYRARHLDPVTWTASDPGIAGRVLIWRSDPKASPVARYLSHLVGYRGGMKNRLFDTRKVDSEEIVATFGEAQLVRVKDRLQLRGGSMAERAEALEWIALFMPGEAVALER